MAGNDKRLQVPLQSFVVPCHVSAVREPATTTVGDQGLTKRDVRGGLGVIYVAHGWDLATNGGLVREHLGGEVPTGQTTDQIEAVEYGGVQEILAEGGRVKRDDTVDLLPSRCCLGGDDLAARR